MTRLPSAAVTMTLALAITTVAVVAAPTASASQTPVVAINELNYHPDDDDPAREFIELANTTDRAIDIGGWCIDGVGDYCFAPGTTIPAHGFIVRTGIQYDGALSNGGEDITILDRDGEVVDTMEYDDEREWPALADGEGASLQRRRVTSPSGHPGNWTSAPPTPGAPNFRRGPLLPAFSDVEHTLLPAPGEPIEISADLDDATSAEVLYVVGFGPQRRLPMTVTDGKATGAIPGQAAGVLVRYRLRAIRDGVVGTWPRQGDGSTYTGTTVRRSVDTELPVVEFFMPDDRYETMVADLTLLGDDGYEMVLAYDGQIFDRARIRVKGQVSRGFPKKKFKVILPAGHEIEGGDLFADDIDEFALHSAWADRSFLRETLASQFMTDAGARGVQQAFPVRLERNGQFFGLYTYVEQPDGGYRDRWDLDDSEVYEVGPDNIFGLLSPRDPGRSESSLRARYDKETFEFADDARLRDFIATVNRLSGPAEREWIYDNVDVASVVNIIAASMVMQNQDWGHKNYRLVFDEYGRTGVVQNDYDLTFGRRWSVERGALDTRVYVGGAFEHPGQPFFATFHFDPELSAMVDRRVRTLTEENLRPGDWNARVLALADRIRPEAVADRAIWGTYAGSADPTREAERIITQFLLPQYRRILGRFAATGRVAATPQPTIPQLAIEDVRYDGVEHVIIRNRSADTVDLSSFEIPEIELVIPGGTVLLPGQAAIALHEDVEQTAGRYPGLLIAGFFDESLGDAPDGITLRNRNGQVIDAIDVLPPRSMTEFSGRGESSAIVTVTATQPIGRGYVQLLDCEDDPGSTANLTTDAADQTRSALGVVRFDADGTSCVFNRNGTHLVVDEQGYFADGAIDDVDDVRLLDTRTGRRPGDRSIVRLSGARPDAVGLVNLVSVGSTGPGFLAAGSCDGDPPTTSNLNWPAAGSTVSNLAAIGFDDAGEACLFVRTGTHVIADLQAYLAPDAFDDTADERLLDTRDGARPAAGSRTTIEGRPGATALVSLVATQPARRGYLQVLACDADAGGTANTTYDRPGRTAGSLTTVRFGPDGTACIFTRSATHIVADLQGYFSDGSFDDGEDRRLLDTRVD